MAFMMDCEDTYSPIAQAVVDSFAVDLNGDMSGFDDPPEEEDDGDFYGDLISRYEDVLRPYGTAVHEGWDIERLEENGLSPLTVSLEDPLEIKLDFIDLGGNGVTEEYAMVLFTVNGESGGADLLGLYVQDGESAKAVVTSGERDLYSLMRDINGVYALEEAASGSAFQSGFLYYHVNADGELLLIEGTVYDAEANADAPWYITHDTDWDVSNDTPCTEEDAAALQAGYTDVTDLDTGTSLLDFMQVDMGLEQDYYE